MNCTNCAIALSPGPHQSDGIDRWLAAPLLQPARYFLPSYPAWACLAFKRGSHGWSYTSYHLHQQPFHISSFQFRHSKLFILRPKKSTIICTGLISSIFEASLWQF